MVKRALRKESKKTGKKTRTRGDKSSFSSTVKSGTGGVLLAGSSTAVKVRIRLNESRWQQVYYFFYTKSFEKALTIKSI